MVSTAQRYLSSLKHIQICSQPAQRNNVLVFVFSF
jgi:hypothetical protein